MGPLADPTELFRGVDDDEDDDGDTGGSAGVREPRDPKPLGPMAGAGEAEPADEPLAALLPPNPEDQPGTRVSFSGFTTS